METMNLTEEILAKLTKRHFYDLFVFNNPKAHINGNKVEIADIIILIDKIVLCIQAKERNTIKKTLDEYKWFDDKVVIKANKQHKDTLSYLLNNEIEFKNSSLSRQFKFNPEEHAIIHITIFKNPFISEYKRYHMSKTLGTYPIFSLESFNQVCDELMTPIDIIRFLPFRVDMAIEYEKKHKGSLIIEVKYNEEFTGFINDFSDPNLITMFVIKSELIDKTASMVQTKRFIRHIDEILTYKSKSIDSNEIYSINMVLSKYAQLDSRRIKDFFNFVDTVTNDINQYGIMELKDESKIIFVNTHYIENDRDKLYYHFEQESFKEGIVVFSDSERLASAYMDFRNIETTPPTSKL